MEVSKIMNIMIVGLGYVGLANAILLSQKNHVIAVDSVPEKVNMINMRKSPIKDKGIESFLQNHKLNLRATSDFESAIKNKDMVIIATSTNYDAENKYFEMLSVEQIICKVIEYDRNITIVIKSTLPIGYTESMCIKYKTDKIMFSPEFLREGRALLDNLNPSRIIVGYSKNNEYMKEQAYRIACLWAMGAKKKDIPILIMHSADAEAVKLFSNTYLALRVAFFNELDTFAEEQGLSTKSIIEGICQDKRIGMYYNNPSFGYGGYCLPKDTKQLLANYEGLPNNIIAACVTSNTTRMDYITKKILDRIDFSKKLNTSKVIGIYRLIMKADSDNFRESAILGIIDRIKEKGVNIVIFEPLVTECQIYGIKLIKTIEKFKVISDIIIANRYTDELDDVKEKVYTRDIFGKS